MIGYGDLGEVVIEAKAVMSRCSRRVMGRIANLTLRQGGANLARGELSHRVRLHLEGCDITSQSIARRRENFDFVVRRRLQNRRMITEKLALKPLERAFRGRMILPPRRPV